ncbi:hypothetical protein COU14_01160 [Candidatus Kaiserbacteria bacterium CG10_big_fil_rev_8_21_14_0_10_44_10]|uniref:Transcobalamin-like C-terminal domain-containing protein n=1 Tax=Candidatus Kaiserbacteria bacterium CG10_big_fil_rev_8_21_14_0_10_44_10 TaxID=1974606 RepID=A0A2H0UJN6_9BACT|nr:MAG: hypothetical protein COU14_01160 [Candidatus Kaiserbacteria bacterium CG10_big_fil_rev_8_21_14_0_10_44_10]
MNKKVLQILGVGTLAVALILGLSVYIDRQGDLQNAPTEDVQETINISLSIEDIYVNKSISVAVGDTAYEVLQALDEEDPELLLVAKEYPGLGILIEGINGKINGEDDKYWQYFVNGTMPQVGADKLELKDGDIVEWRYEVSQF